MSLYKCFGCKKDFEIRSEDEFNQAGEWDDADNGDEVFFCKSCMEKKRQEATKPKEKPKLTQWQKDRVKAIRTAIKYRYGHGWLLLSDEQKNMVIDSECYYLILMNCHREQTLPTNLIYQVRDIGNAVKDEFHLS